MPTELHETPSLSCGLPLFDRSGSFLTSIKLLMNHETTTFSH
jgi:hypothetical protein